MASTARRCSSAGIGSVAITGRVVDIDQLDRGWRVVIAPDPMPGLEPAAAAASAAAAHRAEPATGCSPGDRVSLKGRLYPVPAQVVPGGRDMQRELYFAGIGGVGYSFGAARRIGARRRRQRAAAAGANGCCSCATT